VRGLFVGVCCEVGKLGADAAMKGGTRGSWSKICRLNKASKKSKTGRQSQVLRRTFVVKKGKKRTEL